MTKLWHEPEGYRDVKKDRWTRKCKICEEHTYNQKPVISGGMKWFWKNKILSILLTIFV